MGGVGVKNKLTTGWLNFKIIHLYLVGKVNPAVLIESCD
jgi:hypothetical protein